MYCSLGKKNYIKKLIYQCAIVLLFKSTHSLIPSMLAISHIVLLYIEKYQLRNIILNRLELVICTHWPWLNILRGSQLIFYDVKIPNPDALYIFEDMYINTGLTYYVYIFHGLQGANVNQPIPLSEAIFKRMTLNLVTNYKVKRQKLCNTSTYTTIITNLM